MKILCALLTVILLATTKAIPLDTSDVLAETADSSNGTEMYVDWHGVQFTNLKGEMTYEIRPSPISPIIHSDFQKTPFVWSEKESSKSLTDGK